MIIKKGIACASCSFGLVRDPSSPDFHGKTGEKWLQALLLSSPKASLQPQEKQPKQRDLSTGSSLFLHQHMEKTSTSCAHTGPRHSDPSVMALQRPAPFWTPFLETSHGCLVLIQRLVQRTVTFLMTIDILNIWSVSIMAFHNWVEVDLMHNWFILTYQERGF